MSSFSPRKEDIEVDKRCIDLINAYWRERGVNANARLETRIDEFDIKWSSEQYIHDGKVKFKVVPLAPPYRRRRTTAVGIVSDLR